MFPVLCGTTFKIENSQVESGKNQTWLFVSHVRKPNGQIPYHLETKTCFSLFHNFDLFSSGCFSHSGAGHFKGEAAIIFKTPSTADVLILQLVTVCCLRFRSQFTSITKSCSSHQTVTWYKFPPLSFFYSALCKPWVALQATLHVPARLWLAVIDFQSGEQQSRSGSDKKRINHLQ